MFCAAVLVLTLIAGCATEKINRSPFVLPKGDGPPVNFSEFEPSVRQLAWQANEAFYRDDWKELAENASQLEKAGTMLKGAQLVPAALQSALPKKCDTLIVEAGKLKTAALAEPRSIDDIGRHLQAVHNSIRSIRNEG